MIAVEQCETSFFNRPPSIEKLKRFFIVWRKTSTANREMSTTNELSTVHSSLEFSEEVIKTHIRGELVDANEDYRLDMPRGSKLGLLKIRTDRVDYITADPIHILFTLDISGSMIEMNSVDDLKSKLDYIKETVTNVVGYLQNVAVAAAASETLITISCIVFNDVPTLLFSNIKISGSGAVAAAELEQHMHNLWNIQPHGETNICAALELMYHHIAAHIVQHPGKTAGGKWYHLFMTDGNQTEGSLKIDAIYGWFRHLNGGTITGCGRVKHYLIGMGPSHNFEFMKNCVLMFGNGGCCEYYYLDRSAHSGFVYGEIMHDIIHSVYSSVVISIQNGLIYNIHMNQYCSSLRVGNLLSDTERMYYVISAEPNRCVVEIRGIEQDSVVTNLISSCRNPRVLQDVSAHVLKLQTTHVIQQLCQTKYKYKVGPELERNSSYNAKYNQMLNAIEDLINECKNATCIVPANANMLAQLIRDLRVCYTTMGSRMQQMFCNARIVSAAQHRCYYAAATSNVDVAAESHQMHTIRAVSSGSVGSSHSLVL